MFYHFDVVYSKNHMQNGWKTSKFTYSSKSHTETDINVSEKRITQTTQHKHEENAGKKGGSTQWLVFL